jgi:hypothetical protein
MLETPLDKANLKKAITNAKIIINQKGDCTSVHCEECLLHDPKYSCVSANIRLRDLSKLKCVVNLKLRNKVKKYLKNIPNTK